MTKSWKDYVQPGTPFEEGSLAILEGLFADWAKDRMNAAETRMAVVTLFVKEKGYDAMRCVADAKEIDRVVQYILTGNKPGQA